jgi:hypothetical protein
MTQIRITSYSTGTALYTTPKTWEECMEICNKRFGGRDIGGPSARTPDVTVTGPTRAARKKTDS